MEKNRKVYGNERKKEEKLKKIGCCHLTTSVFFAIMHPTKSDIAIPSAVGMSAFREKQNASLRRATIVYYEISGKSTAYEKN